MEYKWGGYVSEVLHYIPSFSHHQFPALIKKCIKFYAQHQFRFGFCRIFECPHSNGTQFVFHAYFFETYIYFDVIHANEF